MGGIALKTRALRLLRTVTKNRQRTLAAIFAPVMIVIAALASLANNAAASSSPVRDSNAAPLVRAADVPISSIAIFPSYTITETEYPSTTITETEYPSTTITETTTDYPSETITETTTDYPSETITETTTDYPSETITETTSITPSETISVKPTLSPTPKCVPNSKSISYYKDVKGGIEVIVGGHNLVLCHPVYLQSVGWTYEKTNSMWPQNHPVAGKLVIIAKSGTYFIPAGSGCEVDFYASLGSAPVYPQALTARGKPYEPKFVNTYFSGKGAVLFYITPAQCQCGKKRASL
jgi:hypothetical protein